MPTTKNILIFISIGAVFVLIYIFFIKPKAPLPALVSSAPVSTTQNQNILPSNPDTNVTANTKVAQDFLNLLLNVKNIKLDDAIFSDVAFISLRDSSIILIPDGNEGRINPFAPIGTDVDTTLPPTCTSLQILNTTTNTCVTRAICALPQVLNTTTNTCVARATCTSLQFLNTGTNTCVARATCALPQVLNTTTNTCVNPPAN